MFNAPAVVDLIDGQVHMMFDNVAAWLGLFYPSSADRLYVENLNGHMASILQDDTVQQIAA